MSIAVASSRLSEPARSKGRSRRQPAHTAMAAASPTPYQGCENVTPKATTTPPADNAGGNPAGRRLAVRSSRATKPTAATTPAGPGPIEASKASDEPAHQIG